ncbi:MAG: tetratricopeptide repeat protein [Desulfomonile sp.]|nr:tetratricopeptide repeat protein [Desulfomonile sp.]
MRCTKIVEARNGMIRRDWRGPGCPKQNRSILQPMMIVSTVFLTLLMGGVGCVPQSGGTSGQELKKKAAIFYETGVKYLGEGKTPQAIKELTEAEKLSPDNADIQHALGLAFQQKGDYDKAQEQYEKTLKMDPRLTEARNNLGTIFLVKGKFEEAISQFEQCVKDPGYSTPDKAWYNLGIAHFHKKDIDKAIYNYERALQVQSDNINAMFNLGFCHETKEDYAKALAYYRNVLKIDPSFKDALLRVGIILEKTKQYREAIQSVKKALDQDPDFLPAHLQMGILHARLGNVPEAMKKLDFVTKADPKGPLGQKAGEEMRLINSDKFKGIPKESLR